MQQQTPLYFQAIRHDHRKLLRASHRNLFTGVTTVIADPADTDDGRVYVRGSSALGRNRVPQIADGSVTIDATANVRRSLNLTLPGLEDTWDALDTVAAELTVARGVRYVDGSVEWVPCGVFVVDVDTLNYGPDGSLVINGAPDRWRVVQRNMLPPTGRSSVSGNAAWQEIKRLVEGAWPNAAYPFPGWAVLDKSATTKVGALLWDNGDREAAVLDLCRANALEVFFDANGLAVLQPIPQLTDQSQAVWTVDAGSNGVLLDADRTRDRTRAYNVIVVSTAATDVTFLPVEVKNTTASDPLNVNGPQGYFGVEWSSSKVRNSQQARAAGQALLRKSVGVAKQLSLQAVQNDALDASDVIQVVLPQIDRNTPRPTELHIIDTITLPLHPNGRMEIQTRATVPQSLGG